VARHWVLVLMVMAVAVAGGDLYSSRQVAVYRSTAVVRVHPAGATAAAIRLVTGPAFVDEVRADVPFVGDRQTVGDLTAMAAPSGRVVLFASSSQPSFASLDASTAARVLAGDLARKGVSVQLVVGASVPSTPWRPQPGLVLVLALLAGAVVSAGAVSAVERRRGRSSSVSSPPSPRPPRVPSFSGS
jgi:hypothetical protein